MQPPEKLLRVSEVSSRIGVSRPTLYRFVALGRLKPPVKIGTRSSGFPESEINAFIAERISASRMAA